MPGADPDRRGLLDAELHRNGVRGLEADAADIACQAIWVLGHDLDGIGTVGLEDPHRPRRANAVAVQEDHDFPDHLLLGPGSENAGSAYRSDAVDLAQTRGNGNSLAPCQLDCHLTGMRARPHFHHEQ